MFSGKDTLLIRSTSFSHVTLPPVRGAGCSYPCLAPAAPHLAPAAALHRTHHLAHTTAHWQGLRRERKETTCFESILGCFVSSICTAESSSSSPCGVFNHAMFTPKRILQHIWVGCSHSGIFENNPVATSDSEYSENISKLIPHFV